MSLGTINTILSTAPVILQGASKLIGMIRARTESAAARDASALVTLDGLREEVARIESRLDATDEANVEQIRLIEELARQNELLAAELRRVLNRGNLLAAACGFALLLSAVALYLSAD